VKGLWIGFDVPFLAFRITAKHFCAERNTLKLPSLCQCFIGFVFSRQKDIPLSLKFGAVRLRHIHQRGISAVCPLLDDGVFVADFDHRHCWFLKVCCPCVRIDMRQQITGKLFLQFDKWRIKKVESLVILGTGGCIRKAITIIEFSRNMQIDVDINAMKFKLVNQIIESVKLLRVNRYKACRVVPPNVPSIHVMKSDAVETESC
jgi:hypothetical protein